MQRPRGPEEPVTRQSWHGAKSRPNRPARRLRREKDFQAAMLLWPAITFVAVFFGYERLESLWTQWTLAPEQRVAIEQSVNYPGCDAVRAAGKAPLYAGQPGYRREMDGDDDGIACEPIY